MNSKKLPKGSFIAYIGNLVKQYGGLNLAQGIPGFKPPQELIAILNQISHNDVHQYPPSVGNFKLIDNLVNVAFVMFIGLVITDLIFLCQSGQLESLFKFDDINRIPIIASKLLGYLAIFGSFVIHIYITLFRFQRGPNDKHVNKVVASLESVEQAEKS